jgi:hypothetical protein
VSSQLDSPAVLFSRKLDRRMVEHQNWSGCYGEEKTPSPCSESNPGHRALPNELGRNEDQLVGLKVSFVGPLISGIPFGLKFELHALINCWS